MCCNGHYKTTSQMNTFPSDQIVQEVLQFKHRFLPSQHFNLGIYCGGGHILYAVMYCILLSYKPPIVCWYCFNALRMARKQEIDVHCIQESHFPLYVTFECYERYPFLSEHFIYTLNAINQVPIYLVFAHQCISQVNGPFLSC